MADSKAFELLKKEHEGLKKKVAVFSIAGIVLGGGGVFGALTYFVELPLKQENQLLAAKLSQANLDKADIEQTKLSYESQIEVLKSQIESAGPNLARLEKELRLKQSEYVQALNEIEKLKREKRKQGKEWYRN